MSSPLTLILSLLVCGTLSLCPQPYPDLSGGSFTGPPQPFSPDPLVTYVYGPSTNVSQLQVFTVTPQTVTLSPGTLTSSFTSWESLTTATPSVRVSGAGGLVIDFGVELPGWVEIDTPDISPDDLKNLVLGTSEFNAVDIIGTTYKQGVPQDCGGGGGGAPGTTYRLVTNSQLYEGVRYGFITVTAPPSKPFTITGFRAVVQSKPVNYTGQYAGDERTTRIWYAAAYTVRTNLEPDYMGAILEDRGDRYSWAGDAHVSQISSLVAFGNTWDVQQNLVGTGRSQNGIASYSLYFCDSVMDFYAFTHDPSTLTLYFTEIDRILTTAYGNINATTKMSFFGWDDRLGSGFKNASTTESQWSYKLILVKLLARWGATQSAAGNATVGAQFAALADAAWSSVSAQLTAVATPLGLPWWGPLGIHSAAEALSTARLGGGDVAAILSARFNDTVTLCSLSNFNQYWVLLGLAAGGALDRGLASVSLCWGPELDMGGTTFWEISSPDWAAFTPAGDPVPNGVMVQEACDAASAATPSISVLSGAVPLGGEGRVVRVDVGLGGTVTVTLPTFSSATTPSSKATLVLSEALLQRLGVGGGSENCTTTLSSTLPATAHITTASSALSGAGSSSSSKAYSLTWVSRGDASLPPGYTPPLLEEGGEVREGRAAVVVLEGGEGVTLEGMHTFTVSFGTTTTASCACLKSRRGSGEVGPVAPYPFPPPTYPAQLQGLDSLTRGNWVGRYGGDGGVLFGGGSGGDSTPRAFLPPYIQAVTPTFSYLQGVWQDATNTSDTRAPQDPTPPTFSSPQLRTAGYLADSMGGDPTYAVDVPFATGILPPTFLMAVYAVDWDTRGRRQTLALLDLETLNPIAPIQGLKDFTEGVWVVWRLFKNATATGVRLRVSQTRGDNAVVSAILFSSQ